MDVPRNRTLSSVLSRSAQPSCCMLGVSHRPGLRPVGDRAHGRLSQPLSSRRAALQRQNLLRVGAALLERVEPRPMEEGPMGVVLVDSGANTPGSAVMLEQFANIYKQATKRENVEVARLENSGAAFEQAVQSCVQKGAIRVVVVPYFVSSSSPEAQNKIPYLVADVQQSLPGVKCVIAEPIGLDSLMVDLIENRVSPLEPWNGPKVAERNWAGGVLGAAPGAAAGAASAASAASEARQGNGAAEATARGASVAGEPMHAAQHVNTMSAERAWEVATEQVAAAAASAPIETAAWEVEAEPVAAAAAAPIEAAAWEAPQHHQAEDTAAPTANERSWEAPQQHSAPYVSAERAWEAAQQAQRQQHSTPYVSAERAWEAAQQAQQQQASAGYVSAERAWEAAQQQYSAPYVSAERAWEAAQQAQQQQKQAAKAAPLPNISQQQAQQPSPAIAMAAVEAVPEQQQAWEGAQQAQQDAVLEVAAEVVPEAAPVSKVAAEVVPEAAPVSKVAAEVVPEAAPVSKVAAEVVPEAAPVSKVAAEVAPAPVADEAYVAAQSTSERTTPEAKPLSAAESSANANLVEAIGIHIRFSWLLKAVRSLAKPWAWFTRRSKRPQPAAAPALAPSSKFDPLEGRPLRGVSVPKGHCKYDPVRGVLEGGWVAPVVAALCVATAVVQSLAKGLGSAQEALEKAKGAVEGAQGRQGGSDGTQTSF